MQFASQLSVHSVLMPQAKLAGQQQTTESVCGAAISCLSSKTTLAMSSVSFCCLLFVFGLPFFHCVCKCLLSHVKTVEMRGVEEREKREKERWGMVALQRVRELLQLWWERGKSVVLGGEGGQWDKYNEDHSGTQLEQMCVCGCVCILTELGSGCWGRFRDALPLPRWSGFLTQCRLFEQTDREPLVRSKQRYSISYKHYTCEWFRILCNICKILLYMYNINHEWHFLYTTKITNKFVQLCKT